MATLFDYMTIFRKKKDIKINNQHRAVDLRTFTWQVGAIAQLTAVSKFVPLLVD